MRLKPLTQSAAASKPQLFATCASSISLSRTAATEDLLLPALLRPLERGLLPRLDPPTLDWLCS